MSKPLRAELRPSGIGVIRETLLALWASEALSNEAVIRAQTHNLIVYAASDEHPVDQTVERIIEFTSHRPGRVILIEYDSTHRAETQAWATVYCHPRGSRQLCAELVVLEVGDDLRDEIHSTVVSLLAPDLPIYLWWAEPPDPSDHLFSRLVGEVDRLIVDSDTFPNPVEGLKRLAALSSVPLGDLAWARLTPWRRLLAQLWDAPDLRPALDYIHTLEVRHAASGDFHDCARALLLLGWLADRLDWELQPAQRAPDGGFTVAWARQRWQGKAGIVATREEGMAPGEITGITIQAGNNPPYVVPSLRYEAARGLVEICLDSASPTAPRRVSLFEPVSTPAALAEELDFRYDPYYGQALQRAARVVAAF